MTDWLPPGYSLQRGSGLDRPLLIKFMQRTYQELYPDQDFGHLAWTVEQFFSQDTPLWWVLADGELGGWGNGRFSPIGGLWLGAAVDQVSGDRHSYIFLLYIQPEHRHQGIASALMNYAENWAVTKGDRRIGLQVFLHNQPALKLYEKLGYKPQSVWMFKELFNQDGVS